jgi:hypothetical protein
MKKLARWVRPGSGRSARGKPLAEGLTAFAAVPPGKREVQTTPSGTLPASPPRPPPKKRATDVGPNEADG